MTGKTNTKPAAQRGNAAILQLLFLLVALPPEKRNGTVIHEITGISLSAFHRLKTAIFITLGVNVESVELKGKSRLFDEHGKQTVRSYYKIFDFGCFNREKIEQTYLQTGLRAEDDPDEQAERRKTVVNTVKAVNKYRAAYAMELFKIPEIQRK